MNSLRYGSPNSIYNFHDNKHIVNNFLIKTLDIKKYIRY